MVRDSKFAKHKKENPDFKKNRPKIGKGPVKSDNFTNTSVKFQRLHQVKNNQISIESILHQIDSTITSVKLDGYRKLKDTLKKNNNQSQIIQKDQQILSIIFRGLNEEKKEIYQIAGEVFAILPTIPLIIQRNYQQFILQFKMFLNNNYLLNRKNFIDYINADHLKIIPQQLAVDFIPAITEDKTKEKALDCIIYLLKKEFENDSILSSDQKYDMFKVYEENQVAIQSLQQNQAQQAQPQTIYSYQHPQLQLAQFITSQYPNVSSKHLQILYIMQQRFKFQFTNLQWKFPMFDVDTAEYFAKNAYLSLILKIKEFQIVSNTDIDHQNDFDINKLQKVYNLKPNEPKIIKLTDFFEQLINTINDKKLIQIPILELIKNSILPESFLKLWSDKLQICLDNSEISTQLLLDELTKTVLKGKEEEQTVVAMCQKIFDKLQQTDQNSSTNLNWDRFKAITINQKVYSVKEILHQKYWQYGVVRAIVLMVQ